MEFLKLDYDELANVFRDITKREFIEILKFGYAFLDKNLFTNINKNFTNVSKERLVNITLKLLENEDYKQKFYKKLVFDEVRKKIYHSIIWDDNKPDVENLNINLRKQPVTYYPKKEKLKNLPFITRKYNYDLDILMIEEPMRFFLKYILPVPNDYYIKSYQTAPKTQYAYDNESFIIEFIELFDEMFENKLLEYNKAKTKLLVKSIKLLKSNSALKEFFSSGTYASDFLMGIVGNYYQMTDKKSRSKNPLDELKNIVSYYINDKLNFIVAKIFIQHIRGLRLGHYYREQKEMFDNVYLVLRNISDKEWVETDNLLSNRKYKGFKFYFDSPWKTMDAEIILNGQIISHVEDDYYQYFYNPVIKANLFALAVLGIVEIRYEEQQFITPWDGLKAVRLTELGKYIFGYSESYQIKKNIRSLKNIKLDEYKPVITVDKDDVITISKLESYCEKYDQNRYILSSSKIFKDCKTVKSLNSKIERFYNQIIKNPPRVFDEFFENLKQKANLLKKESSFITISLKKDEKLLELFMRNKKIKELIIKAEGYKILVKKENLPKLSKQLKENGFFVEF